MRADVDSLLFPVKLASRRQALICLGLVGFAPLVSGVGASVFGCGYSPALAGAEAGLAVRAAGSLVPEPLVLRAVLRGARERLGELGSFDVQSSAVLTIDVVRLDELGAAPRLLDGRPQARSEELVLRARGRVLERGELVLERELSRRRLIAAATGLELDRDGALVALGSDVGRALADAVLGLPTPGEI